MENFISYKGFKIEPCAAGYSAWGKSPFYPIDTMFASSKSLAALKRYLNDWLTINKLKKWRTMFPDYIAKEAIVWPR